MLAIVALNSITLLFESSFFGDINLILKIFALLMIIGFVRQYVSPGILATIVTLVVSYFVLFVNWWIFGSIYLVYTLLAAGVSGIMVDFFFVMPGKQPKQMEEKPDSDGISVQNKMHQMQGNAQQHAALMQQRAQQNSVAQRMRMGR